MTSLYFPSVTCLLALCFFRTTTQLVADTGPNPCPSIFSLDYPPTPGEIVAVVKLTNSGGASSGIEVKATFATSSSTPSDQFTLKLDGDDDKTALEKLNRRTPVFYKVRAPISDQDQSQNLDDDDLLQVVKIEVNGRTVCSRTRPVPGGRRVVNLSHRIAGSSALTSAIPCGTPITSATVELVVRGTTPERENWPWLVAIYTRDLGKLEFKCGSTLVTDTLVVTAAHCVTNKNTKRAIPKEIVIVRLGVYNIEDWTDDHAETRAISNIFLNNYYQDNKLINDIALLTLAKPVQFSDYIRPACLWEGDTKQDDIYNKKGHVVGWGRDEYGFKVTTNPQMIEVPIVSTLACRGSDARFHVFTFNTTFCAGERNGAGPCSGDSGGGLYMKVGQRWFLRGIVSNALKDNENQCDLNHYVIYTDSALYLPWINEHK